MAESFLKTFHDVSEEVASVLIKPAAKIDGDLILKKYKEATAAERKQHKGAAQINTTTILAQMKII